MYIIAAILLRPPTPYIYCSVAEVAIKQRVLGGIENNTATGNTLRLFPQHRPKRRRTCSSNTKPITIYYKI